MQCSISNLNYFYPTVFFLSDLYKHASVLFCCYFLDHAFMFEKCVLFAVFTRFKYPDVIVAHRPEVVLDTSRMGQDVVVVKNQDDYVELVRLLL